MSAYYELDLQKMIAIRKGKKISQKKLAEMTGLSIGTIQGYEQGKFRPKKNAVEKICAALDIGPDAILVPDSPFAFDTPLEFEMEWYSQGGGVHPGDVGHMAAVLVNFQKMNDAGQQKLVELAELLAKVPEFQK